MIREEEYLSILQGPDMGWRGWASGDTRHKKEVDPIKNINFVIEKYVWHVQQDG